MKYKNQLKNKYVLVTGASSDIGFQIWCYFLQAQKVHSQPTQSLAWLVENKT